MSQAAGEARERGTLAADSVAARRTLSHVLLALRIGYPQVRSTMLPGCQESNRAHSWQRGMGLMDRHRRIANKDSSGHPPKDLPARRVTRDLLAC